MKILLFLLFSIITLFSLTSCSNNDKEPVIRLGINPWPGYEFIYLADRKGFFEDANLKIDIVELSSLADAVRLFNQKRIDAMASTIVEVVDVATHNNQKIDIVMVPDFSNGGDVILATNQIGSVKELKNRIVGAEVGLLGTYILSRALSQYSLELADVKIKNVEQLNAKNSIASGEIDAIVTYPPFSIEMLKINGVAEIFSTAEIPNQIIDTVSIRHGLLKYPKNWQERFIKVWQRSLDYAKEHPEEAYAIMGERQGLSVSEFKEALTGLEVLSQSEQQLILSSDQLRNNIFSACKVVVIFNTEFDCKTIHSLVNSI